MIAAFDVHYTDDNRASAAALIFYDYKDSEPANTYTTSFYGTEAYIPGEFYRRELPCIIQLVKQIKEPLEKIIIDGYVMLGIRPGLGRILFNNLEDDVPVIGVPKSKFKGSTASEVYRGRSWRPLYVTTAGMDVKRGSEKIRMMHGPYRVPTLLKKVDQLTKRAGIKGE